MIECQNFADPTAGNTAANTAPLIEHRHGAAPIMKDPSAGQTRGTGAKYCDPQFLARLAHGATPV
ncbi:MAG TPA: hypothetical protein VKA18_12175 [Alphaproteobacteria bacterium]|nr:hypothetical protein [Alphaproteobacteria bacterium]